MGFFSRLGQMVDGGISKFENSADRLMVSVQTKEADSALRDVAQLRQHKHASGIVGRFEKAADGLMISVETSEARSALRDVAQLREHQLSASVNGGETVHSVSFPVATPSGGKAPKLREI